MSRLLASVFHKNACSARKKLEHHFEKGYFFYLHLLTQHFFHSLAVCFWARGSTGGSLSCRGHPSPSGAPSVPARGLIHVRCPHAGCSLGRALGLPANAREGTPVLNRGIGSFCCQGLYGLGRGETSTFQSLTGPGKRRAVQINATYNKSESCQNWVFHTHCRTETYFFWGVGWGGGGEKIHWLFFFHLEMSYF